MRFEIRAAQAGDHPVLTTPSAVVPSDQTVSCAFDDPADSQWSASPVDARARAVDSAEALDRMWRACHASGARGIPCNYAFPL